MKKSFPFLVFLLTIHLCALAQFVDPTFNPKIAGIPTVYTHEVQSDGKILLSGDFVRFGDQSIGSIIRVNPDGTLDETFTITETIGNNIIDRIEQISSDFIVLNSGDQDGSWILNSDGTLRTNIDKEIRNQTNHYISIGAFALDKESILVKTHAKFIKMNISGAIDKSFSSPLLSNNERPKDVAIQDDGKIVVVGYMT